MSHAATASRSHTQKHTKMPTSAHAQYGRRKKSGVADGAGAEQSKSRSVADTMSLEGRMAMQLALEDSKKAAAAASKSRASSKLAPTAAKVSGSAAGKTTDKARQERQLAAGKKINKSPRGSAIDKIPETRNGKGRPTSGSARKDSSSSSVTDDGGAATGAAGKSPKKTPSFKDLYEMHESMRMHRDITDINYDEKTLPRQALGGGKIENAMEIVEIVNADAPPPPEMDVDQIDELARINSMDKVAIWMQATDHEAGDKEPPADLVTIPEGRKLGKTKSKTKFSLGGADSD